MLFATLPAYGDVPDFVDVYSGILEGDDHGIWTAIIESTGYTKIIYYSIDNFTMDGVMGYLIDAGGNISTATAINGIVINARIHSKGKISGSWSGQDSSRGSFCAVKQNVTAQYAGTYYGIFPGKEPGEEPGKWTMNIDNSGRAFGMGAFETMNTRIGFMGAVDDYGGVRVIGERGIASFYITGDDVDGVLFDQTGNYSNSFTGVKQTTVRKKKQGNKNTGRVVLRI
jgi:hypothetical protein